jgi:enoyl-CoA hydratase/carnithine racemase
MWPLSLATIMRAKVGDGRLQLKIALEGHRFTPQEALDAGLVDHIVAGNTETVLARAVSLADGVGPIANQGVWGIIKVCVCPRMFWLQQKLMVRNLKTTLYADVLEDFRKDMVMTSPAIEDSKAKARL